MVLRVFASLLVAAAVSACLFGGSSQSESSGESHTIVFIDSEVFDKQVSSLMASKSESITVVFAAAIMMNESPPERLEGWLVHVGGAVEASIDPDLPAVRSPLLNLAMSMSLKAYNALEQRRLYKPADRYSANVFYAPADGTITRVVFTWILDGGS